MTVYKLGSTGDEVRRIQERLKEEGLYTATPNGVFGGATEAAVKAFQARELLEVDGKVGPITWKLLMGGKIPKPALLSEPLATRSLALTGCFETSTGAPDCFACVSGDFDGQGISFGALQWNFGQGTLQKIFQKMLDRHPQVMERVFHSNLPALVSALQGDKSRQVAFARSIQHPVRKSVNEPWRGMFKALGLTPECQAIQSEAAADYRRRGEDLRRQYGLTSQRAAALMFDITVQNGGIKPAVRARILADVQALPASLSAQEREVAVMKSVANRRAEAAATRWVEDVRKRKLCIALGTGEVHGIHYDLAEQFGIGLDHAA